MNNQKLAEFFVQNQFTPCLLHSLPEKGMGNKVDAFISGDVLLRVVADRGQRFIDLARSDSADWIDIFTLALKTDAAFQVESGSFAEAVNVLTKYWPKLTTFL
jgi:hypothetical protein